MVEVSQYQPIPITDSIIGATLVTTTPAVRLFSNAGYIIKLKRAALDPNNASVLCFLAENLP